jgi:hypothetical protein
VLRKRDFLDLDNPLLAWMLDYDAVSAVLKSLPAFKGLAQEAMEHVLDRWVGVGVEGLTGLWIESRAGAEVRQAPEEPAAECPFNTPPPQV